MCYRKWIESGHATRLGATVLVTYFALFAIVEQARAIPTFARKYHTSCITCHTVYPMLNNVGEAFRINGYQFPMEDDILVKEEPIPLGSESYKDMWPNSVWPSDLPALPPLFVRAQLREIFNTDPAAGGVKWDQNFPDAVSLGGAGTFGKNISAWWEVELSPPEEEVGVERAFVQFSNLFSWDTEDDEDGQRAGHRWINLPPRALNLRIGSLEPQVLPHYWSEHSRITIAHPMTNGQYVQAQGFGFEAHQTAIELHGVIRQYTSYVVGLANGGNVAQAAEEDNNNKDFYFRVAHRWFGYPLDGRLTTVESGDQDQESAVTASNDVTIRGQSPDADLFAPPQLDWWRTWSLDTAVFGWWGTSELDPALTGLADVYSDDFRRVGADARLRWRDLDIYALFYWGHEEFAGLVNNANLGVEDFYTYAVQGNYYVKPWIMAYTRYEQSIFNESARVGDQQARLIPGVNFVIRQNMKLQAELVADMTGRDNGDEQATDQLLFQLDYVY